MRSAMIWQHTASAKSIAAPPAAPLSKAETIIKICDIFANTNPIIITSRSSVNRLRNFLKFKRTRTGPSLCKKQIIFPGIFCISRKWWSAPDSSETHHCPPRPAREQARSHGLHGSSDRTKDRSYEAHPDRHPPRRTYTMFLVHHWPPISRSARPLPKKPDCDTPH